MSTIYNPAFDGKVNRWRVQCGFECGGERCPAVGECGRNPEGKKASEVGIYCRRHAREDGRTTKGRNSHLKKYVMTLSADDKKRARADVKEDRFRRKKTRVPADKRKITVSRWLGSVPFEECSVFHREMILDELRVPPLLLGDRSRDPTRVYLMNDFPLDDLKYLFEKRADGRQLFFVRGSSIIRCDIFLFVGVAWFVFLKH